MINLYMIKIDILKKFLHCQFRQHDSNQVSRSCILPSRASHSAVSPPRLQDGERMLVTVLFSFLAYQNRTITNGSGNAAEASIKARNAAWN